MQDTLPITISDQYHALWRMPLTRSELKRALGSMCRAAARTGKGMPISGLDLYLVDDAAIAGINKDYLHCAGPTNILSFPGGEGLSGTLCLSLDSLERECHLYGQRPLDYCLHLLAHGIAHLAGLEHGLDHDAIHHACLAAVDDVLTV